MNIINILVIIASLAVWYYFIMKPFNRAYDRGKIDGLIIILFMVGTSLCAIAVVMNVMGYPKF